MFPLHTCPSCRRGTFAFCRRIYRHCGLVNWQRDDLISHAAGARRFIVCSGQGEVLTRGTRPSSVELQRNDHNQILLHSHSRFFSRPASHYEPELNARDYQCKRARTPSEELILALESSGYKIPLTTPQKHSVDLSWISASRVRDHEFRKYARQIQKLPARKQARLSVATIAAEYIRHVNPLIRHANHRHLETLLDEAVSAVFNDRCLQYLEQQGYSVEDVVSWVWILTSEQSDVAAMRSLILYTENTRVTKSGFNTAVPPFILNFTLRRERISAGAFRNLLWLATRMLGRDPYDLLLSGSDAGLHQSNESTTSSALLRSGDFSTVMIIIVRLLRVAAKVLPSAIPYIAELFTSAFGSATVAGKSGRSKEDLLRLYTKLYNKCLSLISRPCQIEPYRSVVYQQQAVFHLLREMTNFRPVLSVTREGYQAVVHTQAARAKSPAEREWANMKAKSWPPWKEEKLGIDADRGNEGKISKTLQAIHRMTEAGYGMTLWERVASIVAGWDIDGTPTIQTRTLLPPAHLFRKRRQGSISSGAQALAIYSDPVIWAARIRATRTVREAWACFLAHREFKTPPNTYIYFEMMQKLISCHRLQKFKNSTRQHTESIPGDGKEVFPEPSSPRDVIYVKSEPPTPTDFLFQMFSENIGVSRPLLILVLNHIDSFEAGLTCLWRSELSHHELESLTYIGRESDPVRREYLSRIPDNIFAAFIGFLCRFFKSESKNDTVPWHRIFPLHFPARQHRKPYLTRGLPVSPEHALSHATFLMQERKPYYLPAWYNFISALQRPRTYGGARFLPIPLQMLLAWREIMLVLQWMKEIHLQVDLEGIEILCKGFVRVLQAFQRHESRTTEGFQRVRDRIGFPSNILSARPFPSATSMLNHSLGSIKHLFYQIVSPQDLNRRSVGNQTPHVFPRFPRTLFSTPSPSTLHALIRALGYSNDREGIITLLRWMKESEWASQIPAEKGTARERLIRRCVVAIRVFLERASDESPSSGDKRYTDTLTDAEKRAEDLPLEPLLREAYVIIQNSESLSPWPSSVEVYNYRRRMS
ncbi:hypothetical protein VTO42DRAFT_5322 [Malbranchea cinnamomea]